MVKEAFLDMTRRQKITMERNMHATYYYIPSEDLYEVKCSLNDYAHDVSVIYKVDMNKGVVVDAMAHMDMIPEDSCKCAPKLLKRVIGMDITRGFSPNVMVELMGKDGCENLAELMSFSGGAMVFIWARHQCEQGKISWDQFGNTIFPYRINTCLTFNPQFDPKSLD